MAKLKTGRHTSALKTVRQAARRAQANRMAKDKVKALTKQLMEALSKKDLASSQDLLKKNMSAWTRLGRSHVVHHAAASRKIARLSRAVHRLATPTR